MISSRTAVFIGLLLLASAPSAQQQQAPQGPGDGAPRRNPGPAGAMGVDAPKLPDQPQIFDTAAAEERRIRRIHDRVHLQLRDVFARQLDAFERTHVACAKSRASTKA